VCSAHDMVFFLLAVRFNTSDVPHSAPAAEVLSSGHFKAAREDAQRNWECCRTAVRSGSEKVGVRNTNAFVQVRNSVVDMFYLNHMCGWNLAWYCFSLHPL
jgi:hypothetical protein